MSEPDSVNQIAEHYERLERIGFIGSPLEAVRNANHLLIFGFFVSEAFQAERIVHGDLASVVRVHTGGPGLTIQRPPGDLFGYAENLKLALIGTCLQAVDQALTSAFGARPTPLNASSDLDWARISIYMIRSCFAHNPFLPTWECRGPYAALLSVSSIQFTLDTRELHGQAMMPDHFGGLEKMIELLLYCERQIEHAEG